MNRLGFLVVVVFTAISACGAPPPPIRIGDINSFSGIAAPFTGPYKQGVELAVNQVNAQGGIGGRQVQIVFRDDKGQPSEATREAAELVNSEHVDVLAGTFLSNIALAVSDWSRSHRVMFVAAEPLTEALTWKDGHPFVVRVRPNTYEQGVILASRAAKLPYKRWATIGPNYEYGHRAWETFWASLKRKKPDAEVVGEFWPPLGRPDPANYVNAILEKKPQAVFVSLFGTDWLAFVREARKYDFFKKVYVVGILLGEPEYLDPLKAEVPEGMLVTGYPRNQVAFREHVRFVRDYEAAYHKEPMLGSLVGYLTYQSIFAAIRKAGRTDAESLSRAFQGLRFNSAIGPLTFRGVDGQSTMGAWVGRLKLDRRTNSGVMTEVEYVPGDRVLPPEADVLKMRSQH